METHSAHDIIIVCKMCLALLATEDLVGVEIYVICEAHDAVDYHRTLGDRKSGDLGASRAIERIKSNLDRLYLSKLFSCPQRMPFTTLLQYS